MTNQHRIGRSLAVATASLFLLVGVVAATNAPGRSSDDAPSAAETEEPSLDLVTEEPTFDLATEEPTFGPDDDGPATTPDATDDHGGNRPDGVGDDTAGHDGPDDSDARGPRSDDRGHDADDDHESGNSGPGSDDDLDSDDSGPGSDDDDGSGNSGPGSDDD